MRPTPPTRLPAQRPRHAPAIVAEPELLTRGGFLRSLALPLAAAVSFRVGAALSVIGQPRMPPLVGPYSHVGVHQVRVAGGCRAKIFYPASSDGEKPAPYCTDGRATSDGMAGLVGFRQVGLSFLLAHLADAPSGCTLDAPPVGDACPRLIYSHGFGGNMDMASYFMRQLASHGIVVVALEHTDGTASRTVAADGAEAGFSPGRMSQRQQLERRAEELQLASDASNLILERGATAPLPPPTTTYLGGHSYGGPAALLAAATAKTKVDGLLLHDPAVGMNGGIDAATGRVPEGRRIASFTSDEYNRAGVRCGATYHVMGGFHGNFVDAPLWAPLWVMRPLSLVIPAAGPADPEEVHAGLARAAARFMREGAAAEGLGTVAPGLLEWRGR